MSLFKVFDTAGTALSAQSVRLNTVASNLANAESAAGTAEQAYKPKQAVFQTLLQGFGADQSAVGVKVADVVTSDAPPRQAYEPNNPVADEKGYVYYPNVSAVEEMANMISASRSYQTNVEVMNTAKQLLVRTLQLGQ